MPIGQFHDVTKLPFFDLLNALLFTLSLTKWMKIMNLVERAALFAKAAHMAIDQKRKYTFEPYHTHPYRVADMVREHGGTDTMIAAAYLHDVVEDTSIGLSAIQKEFGLEVATLVDWLSDMQTPADGNRATRKQIECERLSHAPYEAKTIKLADLIDNTKTIVDHDLDFATIYLQEKTHLLKALKGGHADLWAEANRLCHSGMEKVKVEKELRRERTYRVYINGNRKETVYSEQEAWGVIDKHPMGVGYEVRDADDKIRREFLTY